MRDCKACCKGVGEGCHVAVCGNDLVEGDETCDGATDGSCAGDCLGDCTCAPVTACGNATVDPGEQCDGAADAACPQRCRPDCTCGPEPTDCGNGVIDAGEQCDGSANAACEVACGSNCSCVPVVCGNDVVGAGEECDGTTDVACPGRCRQDCTCEPVVGPVCGNGVHEVGEACDPGVDDFACDVGCLPDCTCAVCGNEVIQAPAEVCEPTDDAACPGLCSSQSCACLSPTTDTCEAPRELATFPTTDRQSTIGATNDATDPVFTCRSPGSSVPHGTVWYALTAPRTGRVTADTGGSWFDTLLAAYTGTCGALTSVACSDDTEDSLRGRIEFPVVEGGRYFLQAAGYSASEVGDLLLGVDFKPCGDGVLDPGEACDPNLPASCTPGVCTIHCECLALAVDECADAAVATELPIHVSLATSQTTGTAADPVLLCASDFEPPSAWFRFVAPTNGIVVVTTDGSDYDTVLGVLTGECDALTIATCDDDGGEGARSRSQFPVVAGTTYTLLVTSYQSPANRLELTIAYQTP
jgi:hypothetical protein